MILTTRVGLFKMNTNNILTRSMGRKVTLIDISSMSTLDRLMMRPK